jgi:hypothetical protein
MTDNNDVDMGLFLTVHALSVNPEMIEIAEGG